MGFTVINVKDYGAVADGSHDDTVNIQNAFDAAFGTRTSPNAFANSSHNFVVFFPAGNYKVTAPLYLTGICGGRIFGAGPISTNISYTGALSGNVWVPSGTGSEITPLLMLVNVENTIIEGMSFNISGANTACVWVFQSSVPPTISSKNFFVNVSVQNATVGFLGGYGDNGSNCDNQTFESCVATGCTSFGWRVVGQNAVNWALNGCGAASCGTDGGTSAAAVSMVGGNISPIVNPSFSLNFQDVYNSSGSPTVIIGGSSESVVCLVSAGQPSVVQGVAFRPSLSNVKFVDATGGGVTLTGCTYSPNVLSGTNTVAALGNTGVLISDNLVCAGTSGSSGLITGTSGSKVYLRGTQGNSGILGSFTGTTGQNI